MKITIEGTDEEIMEIMKRISNDPKEIKKPEYYISCKDQDDYLDKMNKINHFGSRKYTGVGMGV